MLGYQELFYNYHTPFVEIITKLKTHDQLENVLFDVHEWCW